jgi:hypothetical protein
MDKPSRASGGKPPGDTAPTAIVVRTEHIQERQVGRDELKQADIVVEMDDGQKLVVEVKRQNGWGAVASVDAVTLAATIGALAAAIAGRASPDPVVSVVTTAAGALVGLLAVTALKRREPGRSGPRSRRNS